MKRQPQRKSAGTHALHDCWNRIGVWGDSTCAELERQIHCRNCPVFTTAAVRLLDSRELPSDYLEVWTQHYASAKSVATEVGTSIVIFRVGIEWLGLSTSVFQEIAENRVIHSLPHRRSGAVLGVANIRGELVICVSLPEVLGLENSNETLKAKRRLSFSGLLVIRKDGSRYAIPVDEVVGTHRFELKSVREPPATVGKAPARYTKSMVPWNDKAVGCLDEDLLFYMLNRSIG